MNLERRIGLLKMLGEYIVSDDENWAAVKEKAHYENGWFIPEFIEFQLKHIAQNYLQEQKLKDWIGMYSEGGLSTLKLQQLKPGRTPKTIGIVMAGNIPLAGFHDFLAAFISGHKQVIKSSSKDTQLLYAIVEKLKQWEPKVGQYVAFSEQLKNCDAYIATGSNNSARYFDYYFSRYPHIIRRNRTSVAVLSGNETVQELEQLADDVYLYFGLGCRNVTKIYVPRNYDFLPLLEAFKKYNWVFDNHKYKNNYDYQLAIMIINKIYYMTNGSILLREDNPFFSPISQLNYEFYDDPASVHRSLENNDDIQCVVGRDFITFGQAQKPGLNDYADKADTLKFLLDL